MIDVPAVVRNKARAAGAEDWLERLPALVSSLEADWSITVGHPYEGGTEAFVADATLADGTLAVLKVLVQGRPLTSRRLVGGDGCPVLYRYDPGDGALLMERLGRPMHELGLPLARRLEILCATVELLGGDPVDRARWLAARTGLDLVAIWEWGVVERLSTGLLCTRIHLQPLGRDTLAAAEAVADLRDALLRRPGRCASASMLNPC